MSDHPKEAERNLKWIFVCNDIYLDVFRLLPPAKVGLELALVSDTFDALVDTNFKSRKWTLGNFGIYKKAIYKMNGDGSKGEELPIPQKPLPNSIVGFDRVDICEIDSDAIAFLRCIGHLFEKDVYLDFDVVVESADWNTFATSVWPLLNVSAIIKINFAFSFDLQNFRRFISPSILRDCFNLQMIKFSDDLFLQFPPDDTEGSSDGQALCKWLHSPRADDQPKVIRNGAGSEISIDALKATFLNATTSVSFTISFCSYLSSVGPFELVNSLTREQLTNRRIQNGSNWWLLERSPIIKNAEQWAKWKKEELEEINYWKVIRMSLS